MSGPDSMSTSLSDLLLHFNLLRLAPLSIHLRFPIQLIGTDTEVINLFLLFFAVRFLTLLGAVTFIGLSAGFGVVLFLKGIYET